MKRIVGLLYIGIAAALLLYGLVLLGERTIPITPQTNTESIPTIPGSDYIVRIPAANITLPVFNATITGTTWQTTKRGVSYLSTSPRPGEYGNSVMYGHNWPNILGNLKSVKPGDKISVFKDGKETQFIVTYISLVEPNETSVYAPTSDTRLTLYTCAGFLDSKRLVVTALLDSSGV